MTHPKDDPHFAELHLMMLAAADNYSVPTYETHIPIRHDKIIKQKALAEI